MYYFSVYYCFSGGFDWLTSSEGSSSDDSATGFLAGTTALVVALTGATTTEAV